MVILTGSRWNHIDNLDEFFEQVRAQSWVGLLQVCTS